MSQILLSLYVGISYGIRLNSPEGDGAFVRQTDEQEGSHKTLHQIIGNLKFGQDCPQKEAPKVAVCLVGLSRHFASPKQTEYINSMLLKPIQDAGARGITRSQPDVFVHMKLGDSKNVAPTREASNHGQGNKREWVVQSAKEVGATDVVIEEEYGPVVGRQNLTNPGCFHPHGGEHGLKSIMSYWKSINGCLEMISKTESSLNEKYDHVIHARPDISEFDSSKEVTQNAVQCSTSLFVRDSMSFQTRDAFEISGNNWYEQFQNAHPSMCSMKSSAETMHKANANKVGGRYIR